MLSLYSRICHCTYGGIISILLYQLYWMADEVPEIQRLSPDNEAFLQEKDVKANLFGGERWPGYPHMVVQAGSSIWCSGSNSSNRICHFNNLCYLSQHSSFVFFHSANSTMNGVPTDRFNPALLDLSSVENHNQQYFNYIDVPSAAALELLHNVEVIQRTSLIFNRFHPDNIMHVFHDDLLPLYTTLKMIHGGNIKSDLFDVVLIFADEYQNSAYISLYEMYSHFPPLSRFEMDNVKSEKDISVCFSDVYVGLSKHSTWYQYGFYEPQGPRLYPSVTSHDIRQFAHDFRNKISLVSASHGWLEGGDDFILLISRKDTRLITNEMELSVTLARRLNKKVVSVSMESHSIAEIVETFSRAALVIGMHGSMMIFSIFLPYGSIIVELFPYKVNPDHYTPYRTLAGLPGMNVAYTSWTNTDLSKTRTHPDRAANMGGISHLTTEMQERILSSSEVKSHLCCSDPEWLFRIYQDTVVSIDEILKLIDSITQHRQSIIDEKDERNVQDPGHPLFPSVVQDIQCSISCVIYNCTADILCRWSPPWNIRHLDVSIVTVLYEVWVQAVDEEDYMLYSVEQPMIQWTQLTADTHYYLWIKARMHDLTGPAAFKSV